MPYCRDDHRGRVESYRSGESRDLCNRKHDVLRPVVRGVRKSDPRKGPKLEHRDRSSVRSNKESYRGNSTLAYIEYHHPKAFLDDNSSSASTDDRRSVVSDLEEGECSSSEDSEPYIDQVYNDFRRHKTLSKVLESPVVRADVHRRKYHWGRESEDQFDRKLEYVDRMLSHMYEVYDTVTAYSIGMLPPGTIIYYLKPFTLGLDQDDMGWGTARAGPPGSTARVHLKGRFGVVVNRYSQHLKVAETYTFRGKGLKEAKPYWCWDEYIGFQFPEETPDLEDSTERPLEVASTCCDWDPKSVVHLLTDTISLSSQIMIAGSITSDSLARLRTMIAKL
ncbi:hypothetical protein BDV95DRAFT_608245 [Massariosphaeria phaeospora]|uniref:Uncharacterized protein n=1 Tax=Massariosphaeria phaeospora TaxID=100035 RepID=A0A7C8MA67_9PLEO|nr:hypothetical protein BDV95DRAFT_608245 [Massariosphaeria phaeospora]